MTLTATGSSIDNRFEGWSGACSGTSNCTITINCTITNNGNASVTADFEYCAASYRPCVFRRRRPTLDCGDITYRNFTVLYDVPDPDPHGFDGDHDGIGCET